MWRNILSVGNFGDIAELLSPEFRSVFPTRRLYRAGRELVGNYRDDDGFRAARRQRAEALADAEIRVSIDASTGEVPLREGDGRTLLALYFHQLFAGGPSLIDLRPARFSRGSDDLRWSPSKVWVDWDDDFLDGIRRMYLGFFLDDSRFDEALADLQLEAAEAPFRRHFGENRQRAVDFALGEFRETFVEVLRRCEEAGATLHRHFVPLGIYLTTLYDHLEHLGGTYDVRGIFESVVDETAD